MLDQDSIKELAKNFKIAPEHIAREAYEMMILHQLNDSPLSEQLVFKGGTALRLAYGSPRFSEDLDFSITSKIDTKALDKTLQKIRKSIPKISITDTTDKYFTHFVLLKIKEVFLSQTFSIKLELSKRIRNVKSKEWFRPVKLKSPTSPLTVVMNVMTEEAILHDKLDAVKNRIKPRDLFDLWFLSEILKRPMPHSLIGFTKHAVKSELHKFLPRNYHHVVEYLMKKYAHP